ncbi:MAG TPA: peroxiredoxin [Steroidobacteraceae bacterium]|nr:peroxiredoxin [Steroidobacteraceae bacterium]
MKRFAITALVALSGSIVAAPSFAAVKVGATAPLFTTEATLAGKPFKFSLAQALKKGPVVLYFYPAAFTPGCTIEAHEFAAAMPQFKKLGATVIGVSHDKIATLNKFSVTDCRKAFPVASDASQRIMKSYDAVLPIDPKYANRTSYVISPNDKIIFTYTALNPHHHVAYTMAAVEKWNAAHKAGAAANGNG